MGRVFGTDGVRGLANAELTAELALDLAVRGCLRPDRDRRRRVAGRPQSSARDTRASGEFLEAAVVAGLAWPRVSTSTGSAWCRRRGRRS